MSKIECITVAGVFHVPTSLNEHQLVEKLANLGLHSEQISSVNVVPGNYSDENLFDELWVNFRKEDQTYVVYAEENELGVRLGNLTANEIAFLKAYGVCTQAIARFSWDDKVGAPLWSVEGMEKTLPAKFGFDASPKMSLESQLCGSYRSLNETQSLKLVFEKGILLGFHKIK